MPLPFELAAGTIVGRRHVGSGNLLVGRNNQDALIFRQNPNCMVACVADGCSSSPHAEVGARIGLRIIADCILNNHPFEDGCPFKEGDWDFVRQQTLHRLHGIVESATGLNNSRDTRFASFVFQHLQFTVVGIRITPQQTTVFSIGDGCYAINGQLQHIPPFPDNAPAYLGCSLLDSFRDLDTRFQLRAVLSTDELQSVFIGTDGVAELEAKAQSNIPGKDRLVGPIEQFWIEDKYFGDEIHDANGYLIERITPFLRQVNSEHVSIGKAPDLSGSILRRQLGLVQDDVTMMALRRKKIPVEE
jgi:hypothetical protein